jgi:hypothetical protein
LAGELAEQGFNVKLFDLENGFLTLVNNLSAEAKERIELFRLPDTRGYFIGLETLDKVFKGKEVSICDAHGKVSCPVCTKGGGAMTSIDISKLTSNDVLVIDSLTQLTSSAYSWATQDLKEGQKPEFSHWAAQGEALASILSKIQQAPCHIVCITHEQGLEMNDGQEKIVPMCGTKNFARNVGRYFSHVVYCEVKNRGYKRASSAAYNIKVLAGSRSNIAIESDANLTLADIIRGKVGAMLNEESFVEQHEKSNAEDKQGAKPNWKK